MQTLFRNANLLDPNTIHLLEKTDVLIDGDKIVEIGTDLHTTEAQVIDIAGKTLMPGLIDSHVHVVASEVNIALNAELPSSLIALRSAKIMNAMLSGASPQCVIWPVLI